MLQLILSKANSSNQEDATNNSYCERRSKNDYQVIPENRNSNNKDFLYSFNEEESVYCTSNHPNINLFLYTFCYILFILFGALIFVLIEQPKEIASNNILITQQKKFLQKYPCVDVKDLNTLIESFLKTQDDGFDVPLLNANIKSSQSRIKENISTINEKENTSNSDGLTESSQYSILNYSSKWKFTSSLLFVTSIVTTIGYGNITPSTDLGKITCIIFSSIGIPATLTFLSVIVTLFVRGPVKKVEFWIINIIYYLHRYASLFTIRLLHLLIITSILLCICFFIPAYLFKLIEEDWSYLDSLYYCYISLTTIGLGDFIPASDIFDSDIYQLATIFYLYFGLVMIMLWLALVYRIPQFNLNKLLISDNVKEDFEIKEKLRILTKHMDLPKNYTNIP